MGGRSSKQNNNNNNNNSSDDEMERRRSELFPGSPAMNPQHRPSILSAPYKLVLLGTENNGKSTCWKQILSMYGKPLVSWMTKDIVVAVNNNAISSMKALCNISREQSANEAKFKYSDALSESAEFIINYNKPKVDAQFADHSHKLWQDAGIRACYSHLNSRGFMIEGGDTLPYLIENMERIAADEYVPTETDAIRCYTRTRGTGEHINHSEIKVRENRLLVVDTDGQKGQRDKWQINHQFDGVSALVFFVSLTSYDEITLEDEKTNSMTDTLTFFEEICSLVPFADTPLVLVFTKVDKLKSKLAHSPLSAYFPDYEKKEVDVNHAISFIHKKFEERFIKSKAKGRGNRLHVLVMCSVDPNSVAMAVEEVSNIVVAKRHRDHGSIGRRSTNNPMTKIFSNREMNHEQ